MLANSAAKGSARPYGAGLRTDLYARLNMAYCGSADFIGSPLCLPADCRLSSVTGTPRYSMEKSSVPDLFLSNE